MAVTTRPTTKTAFAALSISMLVAAHARADASSSSDAKSPDASAAATASTGSPGASAAATASTGEERSRAFPTAISVIPGVLVHGAGHFAAGDAAGGRRLLLVEGIGIGAFGLGGVGLVASGASRKLVLASSILAFIGAGLFTISWLSDVWGTASGNAPTSTVDENDLTGGAPLTRLPAIETSAGFRYVADPTFPYRSFFVNAIDVRTGAFRVRPEGWFGIGHPNERLRLLGAYRFVGPRPSSLGGSAPTRAVDGSYVDFEASVTRHAYFRERFTITSFEASFAGRIDLARIHRALYGSFADGALGYGFLNHAYAVQGAYPDVSEQLLGRFGWGVYLGRPRAGAKRYGEVSAFYEHRHDGFVGGLKIPGLGSGVLGSFGARTHVWLSDELGVVADVQAGSAWVTGASLIIRQPVQP